MGGPFDGNGDQDEVLSTVEGTPNLAGILAGAASLRRCTFSLDPVATSPTWDLRPHDRLTGGARAGGAEEPS
jgi:hypothetical protein